MKEVRKIFGVTVYERETVDKAIEAAPETVVPLPEQLQGPEVKPGAYYYEDAIQYNNVFVYSYDGEKNMGEAGPLVKNIVNYEALRLRSWDLFLKSEICQTVIKRFARWVIGVGLRLQAEPNIEVLKSEVIEVDNSEDFKNLVENRFRVFAKERGLSDYSGNVNLHKLAKRAFVNAIVGGDVLIILRYIDNVVKVQLVDGCHVQSPIDLGFNGADRVAANGNRVRHGIEMDAKGQHVAYYVRKQGELFAYDRIEAYGAKSGMQMAFMVYGLEYRLDNVRGLPLLSAVMETAKKMDRYKDATLGRAEEIQKIILSIEHEAGSSGENPFAAQLAKITGHGGGNTDVPIDRYGKKLADTVAATTNKTAVNMPPGAKLTALENKGELYFKDFFTTNIDLVCATVDIPPNVAMGKYDSNFSASRAALKDWEHTLVVERNDTPADQFYQPTYVFWLETEILKNKIQAPGYLQAKQQKNVMALAAYRGARWEGANVPHIDPVKEVTAQRLMLGALGAALPLTTQERASEALNSGDSCSITEQFSRELEEAEELGVVMPVPPSGRPVDEENENDKETD